MKCPGRPCTATVNNARQGRLCLSPGPDLAGGGPGANIEDGSSLIIHWSSGSHKRSMNWANQYIYLVGPILGRAPLDPTKSGPAFRLSAGALILLETSALHELFTYLLTYILFVLMFPQWLLLTVAHSMILQFSSVVEMFTNLNPLSIGIAFKIIIKIIDNCRVFNILKFQTSLVLWFQRRSTFCYVLLFLLFPTPYPRPSSRTKNTSHSLTLDCIIKLSVICYQHLYDRSASPYQYS